MGFAIAEPTHTCPKDGFPPWQIRCTDSAGTRSNTQQTNVKD